MKRMYETWTRTMMTETRKDENEKMNEDTLNRIRDKKQKLRGQRREEGLT